MCKMLEVLYAVQMERDFDTKICIGLYDFDKFELIPSNKLKRELSLFLG